MNNTLLSRTTYQRKVPEIIALFWVIKLLTTAMGEATSDYFVFRINPYEAVLLGGVGLIIALALQFTVHRYVAWIYWFAVVMVAIFGTMAADAIHIQLGIPYILSTIFFATILSIVLILWYNVEKTLSIHSIYTPRRELFYWATVLATFALGTAVGDLTASTIGLGYLGSSILFAFIFAIPVIAHWKFNMNEIVAFWFAYIITRPLGASLADWFGKSKAVGGLGYGDGKVSIILAIAIVLCVSYLSVTKIDIRRSGNTN